MRMTLNQFSAEMLRASEASGVNFRDKTAQEIAQQCKDYLSAAVTSNSENLIALPEDSPIDGDTEITPAIAQEALDLMENNLRERKAGKALLTILSESEQMTYFDILSALSTLRYDQNAMYEFVSRRGYICEIEPTSPLYPLVQCILKKQNNFAEVIEAVLAEAGLEPEENPSQPDGITSMISRYKSLLRGCL